MPTWNRLSCFSERLTPTFPVKTGVGGLIGNDAPKHNLSIFPFLNYFEFHVQLCHIDRQTAIFNEL